MEGKHRETTMEINGGYFQVTANPVMRGGKVEGGVLLFVDVTEQRKASSAPGIYAKCLPRAENTADLHLRLCRNYEGWSGAAGGCAAVCRKDFF